MVQYEKIALGDLFDIGSSKRVFQSEWRKTGIPFYRAREIAKLSTDGYVDNELFIDQALYEKYIKEYGKPESGDIMVTGVGTLGVCYVVQEHDEFYFKDGNILWFRQKNKERVIPEYVVKAFDSNYVKEEIRKNSSGTTVGTFTIQTANRLAIPLPDMKEQQIIVNELSAAEKLIFLRKQQLAKLDELVKARFVELMQAYPSNNLLEEFISAYKAERCGDREIPVLSITKEDGIVFQSEKFKKRIASADASTYKVVPRGKLVQGIHIDERNFAIQNIADEGIVSPAYKIWNVNEEKAIPEVLAYAMRTDRTMAYISSKFTGSVKRRESISMNDFMATPIDLPSIKVQTEFYNFMKQTDKSKLAIQQSLDKLETLKKSLMQKYFG